MPESLPELIADRIVIPDSEGRPRIEIGLVDGEPAIRIFDTDGNVRVRLGLEHWVDEEPEYSGLVAELRLRGGDGGGEAILDGLV